jgi:hypothetical protein
MVPMVTLTIQLVYLIADTGRDPERRAGQRGEFAALAARGPRLMASLCAGAQVRIVPRAR